MVSGLEAAWESFLIWWLFQLARLIRENNKKTLRSFCQSPRCNYLSLLNPITLKHLRKYHRCIKCQSGLLSAVDFSKRFMRQEHVQSGLEWDFICDPLALDKITTVILHDKAFLYFATSLMDKFTLHSTPISHARIFDAWLSLF